MVWSAVQGANCKLKSVQRQPDAASVTDPVLADDGDDDKPVPVPRGKPQAKSAPATMVCLHPIAHGARHVMPAKQRCCLLVREFLRN